MEYQVNFGYKIISFGSFLPKHPPKYTIFGRLCVCVWCTLHQLIFTYIIRLVPTETGDDDDDDNDAALLPGANLPNASFAQKNTVRNKTDAKNSYTRKTELYYFVHKYFSLLLSWLSMSFGLPVCYIFIFITLSNIEK